MGYSPHRQAQFKDLVFLGQERHPQKAKTQLQAQTPGLDREEASAGKGPSSWGLGVGVTLSWKWVAPRPI